MSKNDFWKKFQNFLGDKLPPILILILKRCGYDHAIAISELDEEKINSIESFAREQLANILQKDPIYKRSFQTFRFLPGHRATLLALPNLVSDYISLSLSARLPVPTEHSGRNQNNNDIANFSEEQLKKALKKKLERYAKKISLRDFILPIENLEPFETSVNRANVEVLKCIVKCSKCEFKVPCIFNKHWQVSNLEKHLKNIHGNGGSTQQSTDNNLQVASGSGEQQEKTTNPSIVRGVNAKNAKEIDQLINSTAESSTETGANDTVEIPLSDSLENVLKLNNP